MEIIALIYLGGLHCTVGGVGDWETRTFPCRAFSEFALFAASNQGSGIVTVVS